MCEYVRVCVCVCVCKRERERERERAFVCKCSNHFHGVFYNVCMVDKTTCLHINFCDAISWSPDFNYMDY